MYKLENVDNLEYFIEQLNYTIKLTNSELNTFKISIDTIKKKFPKEYEEARVFCNFDQLLNDAQYVIRKKVHRDNAQPMVEAINKFFGTQFHLDNLNDLPPNDKATRVFLESFETINDYEESLTTLSYFVLRRSNMINDNVFDTVKRWDSPSAKDFTSDLIDSYATTAAKVIQPLSGVIELTKKTKSNDGENKTTNNQQNNTKEK